jgi:Fibronectin type III domain
MRSRVLSPFAVVALLGAVAVLCAAGAAAPRQVLAAPSEVTLEVNENCVEALWPCWTTEGMASRPRPTSAVAIASGGTVKFVDHGKEANIAWTGTRPTCESSVPEPPTAPKTGWEGKCAFATPGVYGFESATMFKDLPYEDYTKYTVTVVGTPTDETTSASGETQTGATLNGSIEPQGNAVEYYFEYEGPGIVGTKSTSTHLLSAADFASHTVSAAVGELQSGADYQFKLVASYGAGKTPVAGATQQMFTTLSPSAPTATTLAAEDLNETTATLKGTVNPGGEATEYLFEYGTGTGYGQMTEKATVLASGGSQTVSATLTKLTPGTEYHFRLVAKNKQGPAEGLDRGFKTMTTPASKEPQQPSSPGSESDTSSAVPVATSSAVLATPASTPPILSGGAPLVGGAHALGLAPAAVQHGAALYGSIDVSAAAAGGALEVTAYASGASLAAARHPPGVRVGRLRRTAVRAGMTPFTVTLSARARAALRRHRRLALTVQAVLTPPKGAPVTVTKSIVLRG